MINVLIEMAYYIIQINRMEKAKLSDRAGLNIYDLDYYDEIY